MEDQFIILIIMLLTALLFVLLVVVIFYNRSKYKKLLEALNRMIDLARNDNFNENTFDETMLSATENNFYQYISSCVTSTNKMSDERDKIKELIADISHQTKTPLANILLYSELLLEKELPKESKDSLLLLSKQSEKLNFLIQSLIKIARLESGVILLTPKLDDVSELLNEIAYQVKQEDLVIENTDIKALFDRKWTIEAISNIVDNALKYSKNSVEIKVFGFNLFCRIDIIDTGIGISEEEQAKVFTRFYRSASLNQIEGVGIGLYLSREIIKSQGGYIRVSSILGKGTTFSVFLPI